ncbi:unnamed protein product, partial [Hapterophycus canaliculatus]
MVKRRLHVNTVPSGNGVTALYSATCEGRFEVIRVLVDGEANIDARNSRGDTPLCLA